LCCEREKLVVGMLVLVGECGSGEGVVGVDVLVLPLGAYRQSARRNTTRVLCIVCCAVDRYLDRPYVRRFLCQSQIWDFQCLGYNINGSYCADFAPINLPS
jgi:hypothetical protein